MTDIDYDLKHAEAPQPIEDMEELCDILDGMNASFKVVQQDEQGGKHDCTYYSTLLQHVKTGKYYGFDHESSYNHGFDHCGCITYPLTLDEVEVTPVQTFTWKVKKA